MKQLKTWVTATGAAIALFPYQVMAVENPYDTGLKSINTISGKATGKETSTGALQNMIGQIINVALGFLGIIFLVLMLYAGFLWMTAQGDEGKVKKAREMITQAIIGIVIITAAFAISNFVLTSLVNVSNQ